MASQKRNDLSVNTNRRDLPSALVKLSPEQLEKAPRLTEAEIAAAIKAGQRDRATAEAAPAAAPITPKILYR